MSRRLVVKIYTSALIVAFASFALAATRPLAPDIAQRLKFLPRTIIDYDHSLLDENERSAMMKTVEAAKLLDELYWRQVAKENPQVREELQKEAANSKPYAEVYQYFQIMKGRWDRIERNEPFIGPFGAAGKKPEGAGFYPEDMSRDEFEKWIAAHPADKDAFQSTVTVIQRQNGKLVAVPYPTAYAEWLKPAAQKLKEAAAITKNASLKDFLTKRANSFLSNDYYDSDIAWMDLNSDLEIIIGPYEVYEDAMNNFKASFEAFITVVDKGESQKLALYAQHLPAMEKSLPIPDQYKNPNRGSESPIRVVQEIFTGGDARRGITTAAFNLPNDERVRQAKGSKKILLKNVMDAKFQKTGKPITDRLLVSDQAKLVTFDPYFNHTLFHELSHGLGPGIITGPDGKKVENRLLLKDLYSTIEECKADVVGAWTLRYALDNKLLNTFDSNSLYATYAGLQFRLIRHGMEEAHGKGNVVQWNWLREKNAVVPAEGGRFRVDYAKIAQAVESLATELLTIEATGDYARGKKLLDTYGKPSPEILKVVDGLKDIPVDISPVFPVAGEK
jgi:hypothetical protein